MSSSHMASIEQRPSPTPMPHPDHHPDRGAGTRLRNIILGGQDGLVNVLGLTLGVVAAQAAQNVVVVAGLAATLAESVAMGGVAYTSALAERDFYRRELERERREVEEMPDEERAEIRHIFYQRGLRGDVLERVVEQITSDKEVWVQVMMRDELQLEPKGDDKKLLSDAGVVGFSTIIGSIIPLLPYLVLPVGVALWASIVLSAAALFGVGVYKARTLVGDWRASGLQMVAIGLASALFGYLVGRLLRAS